MFHHLVGTIEQNLHEKQQRMERLEERLATVQRAALESLSEADTREAIVAAVEQNLNEKQQRLERIEERLATVQQAALESLSDDTRRVAVQVDLTPVEHSVGVSAAEWAAMDERLGSLERASQPRDTDAWLAPDSRAAVIGAMAAVNAAESPAQAGADEGSTLFTLLPMEALQRVLCTLPPASLVSCERVSLEWQLAVASLPFWASWRARAGSLSEAAFVLPGTQALAFGAPPADIPADVRAAGAAAAEQARQLPAARLQIAMCGTQWTVLKMGAGGEPSALRQHQARDFMITCCSATARVFSGDKEGQLRVWCARTGEQLARVGFPGSCVLAHPNP